MMAADLAFFRGWADDERMEALYSSSVLNDEDMTQMWLPAVHWSLNGLKIHDDGSTSPAYTPSLLIRRNELTQRFERRGIVPVPVVFDHVLTILVARNQAILASTLVEWAKEQSFMGWLLNSTVKAPVRWGMGSLWRVLAGTDDNEPAHKHPYVSLPILSFVCDHVHARALRLLAPHERVFCLDDRAAHSSCAAREFSFEGFCRAAGTSKEPAARFLAAIDTSELRYIALYLVSTKRAVMHDGLLKLVPEGTGEGIVDGDRTVLLLEHTIKAVETSTEKLHAQVDTAQAKALDAKRHGRSSEAVGYWRHAKLLRAELDTRRGALLNLLSTKHQLHTMHTQAIVVSGYELAAKSLRHVRETLDLSADAAHAAVADWRDVMEEQAHVDAILAESDASLAIDNAALELEFMALSPPTDPPFLVEAVAAMPEPMLVEAPARPTAKARVAEMSK
ncbi:hypothetical protein ACHHYP_02142 [Achlya hypogyna]|uniref:Charged multivesicular body protein 7 n=1 Tax=Achlya hypogyna TaxID=1202772 RepID=A0A1V9ZSD3_ACHHY|nr:hypothetical protein ACHHYP_02142 [Achlya hypogyna]